MKRNRMLFLLILFISSILIFACSAENNTTTEENEPSNENNTTGGNNNTENNENKEDVFEFKLAISDMNNPFVQNHPDINTEKFKEKLEELTNTKIDVTVYPHNERNEKVTLMFASDRMADVLSFGSINSGPLEGAIEEEKLMPLSDLLEEHGQNLLEVIPEDAWEEVTHDDGEIYAIPEFLGNPSRRGTAIRMDLLEETGLDIPTTIDEFIDVLRAFKEMGVEHPFGGREEFKFSDTFFGSFDALPYQWEYDENLDQVVPKFMAQNGEKIKKALEYYKLMYDEGLIHREFMTIPFENWRSNVIAGDTGMWAMNAEELNAWEAEIQNNIPEAEIAIIPSPAGDADRSGFALQSSTMRLFMINNETEVDPAEIIKFFDWHVSDEAEEFFTYGIEGDTYTKDDDGKINYEILDDTSFVHEQQYRTRWLWFIKDATYIKGILELTDEGKELIEVFDEVLEEEGHGNISYTPSLESLRDNPDLTGTSDTPSPLWMTEAVKIITGREPIDYHDEIIDLWLEKGGQEAVEEATERYEKDEGVQIIKKD